MRPTLLIDFDGVLRRWPAQYDGLEAAHDLPVGAIMQVAFDRTRLEAVVTGAMSDTEWRQETAEELLRRFPASSALAAIEAWSEPVGVVDQEVLGLVKEIRPSCQVVLITNGTDRLETDLAKLGLNEAFDVIVNSSRVGVAKPRPEIFQHALAVAGAEPDCTFFVDDSRSSIDVAKSLGIGSHLFQGPVGLGAFLTQHGLRRNAA